MNLNLVLYTMGSYLLLYSLCFIPPILWGVYYNEKGMGDSFGTVAFVTFCLGALLFFSNRKKAKDSHFTKREGLFTVALIWIFTGILGAMPFSLARAYYPNVEAQMPTFFHCFFESVSGLTTTGASVLTNIEALPQALLFWRSFTHFLGGLGVVVLFVAILPFLGVGGRVLFRSEVTGPEKDVVKPKVQETAFFLLKLYLVFTIVEAILLFACGMTVFDSLCHTFGTLATGGFSTKNTSIGHYNNIAIESIITGFMVLAGINFSLYYFLFRGKVKHFLKDNEMRAYFGVLLAGIVLVATDLYWYFKLQDLGVWESLRLSVFQVVSIVTTTGYNGYGANYDVWPVTSQLVVFALFFVGGCAGSTGGGMKVIRWVVVIKFVQCQIENVFRPRAVLPVKIGGKALPDNIVKNVLGLFILWFLIFGLVSLALSAMIHTGKGNYHDFMTAISATASCINNIGPGFSIVGPTGNYALLSEACLFLLTICMYFGRLEIFTIIILFLPAFWEH